MSFLSHLNQNSDITDITWNNRRRFAPINTFSENIMRGPSELSIETRELIAAYVSALNDCSFCTGAHLAVAKQFKVPSKLLDELLEDIDYSSIDEKFHPLFYFAHKLTKSPSKITQSDIDSIKLAKWSEKTIEDLICIVSAFNFFNRLLDGHGIKGNEKVYRLAGNHLSAKGYKVPFFIKLIRPLIDRQKKKYFDQ
jgi:uncharacterized peroxidase-related enzyme